MERSSSSMFSSSVISVLNAFGSEQSPGLRSRHRVSPGRLPVGRLGFFTHCGGAPLTVEKSSANTVAFEVVANPGPVHSREHVERGFRNMHSQANHTFVDHDALLPR